LARRGTGTSVAKSQNPKVASLGDRDVKAPLLAVHSGLSRRSCSCARGLRNKIVSSRTRVKLFTSIWTRLCVRGPARMIRNCAASLSLSRGTAAGPSSAQLLMKQENLACGPQCPQFEEQLCPGAVFLPPDFPRYRAVSQQTREIFKRHTDLIEPLSLDESYLDVSENKTRLPTATQVARTIREQIRSELNSTASAGIAPNKFLAKTRPTGENRMDCSSSNR
jgi:hypothetical protein